MATLSFRVPAIAATLLLAACGQQPPQQSAPPPAQVTVANPVTRTIVDQDEYVGRFLAVDQVEVRARVSGYLEKVHFRDGQLVKEGDLLFTIDRRPFQNTLDQARANLQQVRGQLGFAESDFDRGKALVRDKTITEQTFEQRQLAKRNAEASVLANEAAVRQAELDIQFTELRAPISGRIGDRRVSPGNLVTGGATGNTTLLAMIVTTDPIRVEFTFDEQSYIRYERLAASNRDSTNGGSGSPVELRLIDEDSFRHKGRMDFVDNMIDRTSGTIRGRAQISNPDNLFTPGMFARIQIPGSAPYQALMVPDAAIGSEQVRKYVLAVGADDMVVQKYVTLGIAVDGLRVIKSGIAADDRIIVEGLMRARPGQKVSPQLQAAPPVAGAPAAGATSGATK